MLASQYGDWQQINTAHTDVKTLNAPNGPAGNTVCREQMVQMLFVMQHCQKLISAAEYCSQCNPALLF